MDCVNHSGVTATAYCQSCGKPLCSGCVRKGPVGQIFCDPCWIAWQGVPPPPFVPPPAGAPNPMLAGFLGLIPGVGAMYNGQFVKGLAHIVIFAVLVSAANIYDVFGWMIAGWILYQAFEAYHTARARRDGEPLPDPLGLNDVGSWFTSGKPPQPSPESNPAAAPQNPGQAQYQPPYQTPYPPPYQAPDYAPGPGAPPAHWQRSEPIGAIILIALGLLFLMGRMNWLTSRVFEFGWPLLLIGLGVWLIVRRLNDSHRDSQGGPQ